MKYVISWFERPQGSPIEYENAQKRILEVFGQWKAPANFKIEFFVIRVEYLKDSLLGILVLYGRTLRAFEPADHVLHWHSPRLSCIVRQLLFKRANR